MSTTTEEVKKKKVTLKSSDGDNFVVDEAVAVESQMIKQYLDYYDGYFNDYDGCADKEIALPNVTGRILAKVIEYCEKHVEAAAAKGGSGGDDDDDDLKNWDAEFINVDKTTLFDLVLAANYLNIKSLLDLTCQTVADMIKNKSPEEIGKVFIINDLTPEDEEEKVRKENQWAFE